MTTNGLANMINGEIQKVAEEKANRSGLLLNLTANIACAFLGKGMVTKDDIPGVLTSIHSTLRGLSEQTTAISAPVDAPTPAVNPKKSIHDDYIVCLEDGKKFKSLKRHLMTHYGLTPDAYRAKWGLARDYPMVAPSYAAARSSLAKKMGLGKSRARAARMQ